MTSCSSYYPETTARQVWWQNAADACQHRRGRGSTAAGSGAGGEQRPCLKEALGKSTSKPPWVSTLRPFRRAAVNNSTTINKLWSVGEVVEQQCLVHCWECEMEQLPWKTVCVLLKKLKMELPCDPVIPFLGIHPEGVKARSWRCFCPPMFLVALFVTAKR